MELYQVEAFDSGQFVEYALCGFVEVFIVVNQAPRQFHVMSHLA